MISQDLDVKIIDLSSFFSFEEIKELGNKTYQESCTESSSKPTIAKKMAKMHQFCKRYPKLMDESNRKISSFIVYNFNDITDICIKIMNQVDWPREERMRIRSDLKRISWNCEADFEEGKRIDLQPRPMPCV